MYRLQACMYAFFSPEVLQAGAVKGLTSRIVFTNTYGMIDFFHFIFLPYESSWRIRCKDG